MSSAPKPGLPQGKCAAYRALVEVRKGCKACTGLINCAAVDDGSLDSDRLGPATRWQGNLDAEVLVVGQDFADVEAFRELRGWPGDQVRTNLALVRLLEHAGIWVNVPRQGVPEDVIFLTNAVLCLKQGGMRTPVRPSQLRECGMRFLRPTIELVAPLAVVTLWSGAVDAVLSAFGLRRKHKLGQLVDQGATFELGSGTTLFPMFHPSQLVRNRTRSLAAQNRDWQRLGAWLRQRKERAA